jgi:glycosyltransferase involved in cell wall biosynthesis
VAPPSNIRSDVARLPISGVVATRDRAEPLRRCLESLLTQEVIASELIFVDASVDDSSHLVIDAFAPSFGRRGCQIYWERAVTVGAAAQRNQGVALATQPAILFFDDDIFLEPFCLRRLWHGLEAYPGFGGVSAMISNQHYQTPGFISRSMFRIMAGKSLPSYAGKVIGPAVNLLPEDGPDLPDVVPVEWLNTTCTLYRREALPSPPFSSHFEGYSLMEDVCLSVTVARRWRLANVRGARIFHDSKGGAHKADPAESERMKLVNRHYVMTSVLGRNERGDYLKLALWQAFGLAGSAFQGGATFSAVLRGTLRGIREIARRAPHDQ